MPKALSIAAGLMALVCLCGAALAAGASEQAALAAAQEWLALVDQGDAAASRAAAHPRLAEMFTPAQWQARIGQMRRDLGAPTSRSLHGRESSAELKTPPPQAFFRFIFVARMSKGVDVEEAVTCLQGPQGQWRVADYFAHFK
ncbi:MAG: DUF4019 domain-containing protein [Thermodesulfobacteriota bacterium]